jgi:hypothetical protein
MSDAATTTAGASGGVGPRGADLPRRAEGFDSLVPRLVAHLHETFPGYGFSPVRHCFAHGRSILINVTAGPAGLDDETAAEAFKTRVIAEMRSLDQCQEDATGGRRSRSFFPNVRIDGRYYASHAVAAAGTEVERRMSLAEFRRTIKPGDRVVLESTDGEHARASGNVGVERAVLQVRSGDMIIATNGGRSHFDFPRAAAFACDGKRFRVSDARAGRPNAYRLYRWIRD